VLDEGNGGAAELFSIERVLSGLKVLLVRIDWLDDGGDHSEMLLENVVVVSEVFIKANIVLVLVLFGWSIVVLERPSTVRFYAQHRRQLRHLLVGDWTSGQVLENCLVVESQQKVFSFSVFWVQTYEYGLCV